MGILQPPRFFRSGFQPMVEKMSRNSMTLMALLSSSLCTADARPLDAGEMSPGQKALLAVIIIGVFIGGACLFRACSGVVMRDTRRVSPVDEESLPEPSVQAI